MIPSAFIQRQDLPRHASGKIDFDTLSQPLPSLDRVMPGSAAINNDRIHLLKEIWAQVLSRTDIQLDDHFFDIGGHSLALLEVASLASLSGLYLPPSVLSQWFTLTEIIEAIDQLDASSNSLRLDTDWLAADVHRRPSISMANIKPPKPNLGEIQNQGILVTGATGFLGCYVLYELLQQTTSTIHCLVRARDTKAGMNRIIDQLKRYNLTVSEQQRQRILPHAGDLTQPLFGWSSQHWQRIASAVNQVFHCAARVNLIESYEKLSLPNVDGTWQVISFCAVGTNKKLHYASTLSVFAASDHNSGRIMETTPLHQVRRLYGGYAQSKWAAEFLVRLTMPTAINYRFGLLTGDNRTGKGPVHDQLRLVVRGLVRLGAVPKNKSLALDMTPVDRAAHAMVALALDHTLDHTSDNKPDHLMDHKMNNRTENGSRNTYHINSKNRHKNR